jgi:hypothetical protein
MNRELRLSPIADLRTIVTDGHLVAFNVGYDGTQYVVVAKKPLDYRIEQPGRGSFAKTRPEEPQSYRIVGLSHGDVALDVVIAEEQFNIHDVQPLSREEILLVCGRSYYRGPDDYDRNGRVYSRDGRFIRAILLGDGIETVQATSEGVIWTSYFDEGVFGNYGWRQPVGASGLVAWDSVGEMVFEFQPAEGLDSICDCYALNVASDSDVWCYYYMDFPLVRLRNGRIHSVWQVPISGSSAFAVSRKHAVFRGGYDDRDVYHLLALGGNGKAEPLSSFRLTEENGTQLVADRVVGRGDRLHLICGDRLYQVEVQMLLAERNTV